MEATSWLPNSGPPLRKRISAIRQEVADQQRRPGRIRFGFRSHFRRALLFGFHAFPARPAHRRRRRSVCPAPPGPHSRDPRGRYQRLRVHGPASARSAVIGSAGRGYEITLKTLQISRTMCAALSLGAADTALRAALDFALRRRVFGDTVSAIPSARDQLARRLCRPADVRLPGPSRRPRSRLCRFPNVGMVLHREISCARHLEELVRDAAVVLGARHYLREGHFSGCFKRPCGITP